MVMVSSEVSLGIGIAIRRERSHTRGGGGYGFENVRWLPTLTHSHSPTRKREKLLARGWAGQGRARGLSHQRLHLGCGHHERLVVVGRRECGAASLLVSCAVF